ncbi:MAG: hypothetical protein HY934_03930 [Candidatus Firestonebacteria bacterium]|nr:hypothetical protein [Candidatus Firestonebacteria bacterium]
MLRKRRLNLSRLGAGIGTRVPGEQKLEIDRRRIKEKISRLKDDLDILRNRRDSLRNQRKLIFLLILLMKNLNQ